MLFHSFQFSGTVSTDILRPVLLKSFKTEKGKAWTVKPQGKQVQPSKNKILRAHTKKHSFPPSLHIYLHFETMSSLRTGSMPDSSLCSLS